MGKPVPGFESLADEYARLWADMKIRTAKHATAVAAARMVLAGKAQYQEVERETQVPWWLVGVIHKMECNCSFKKHLHNGDPLTARTKLVPKGRPVEGNPPFAWDDSAEDALTMKGLQRIEAWPVERICYELERYNGFGYRWYHPETLSPYLWSYTNHYTAGKYVRDGVWDRAAVSEQAGAMAILVALAELDETVVLHSMKDAVEAPVVRPPVGGDWEEPVVREFPRTEDEGEPVNAPDLTPRPVIPPERPVEAADEGGGWLSMSERNFAKVNALADQGSRLAQVLQKAKRWFWGLFFSGATASQLVDTKQGSANVVATWVAENAFLVLALALGVVAGVVYLTIKVAEKYLVTAAKDKRYLPRGET